MTAIVKPRAQLIAWTHFRAPDDVDWSTDADGGQALAEFAGRACYQSWGKPNPATANNADYLRHILEVGHLSVLEHGTATFYFTGVSRSFTHELIRHRHFSYSQLSQRYCDQFDFMAIYPQVILDHPHLTRLADDAVDAVRDAYDSLTDGLEEVFAGREDMNKTQRRKAARQAARCVLPNATETRIVVTGNYRAWRHFIAMRATEHADVEIREVAVAVLRKLQQLAPNVFDDFVISALPDGTEVAASTMTYES